MMNLKMLLNKVCKIKIFAMLFLLISFAGFVDASFLTIKHFQGVEVNCNFTTGCGDVLNSKYSAIFGIPAALLGSLYYLGIFILSFIYLDVKKKKILIYASKLTILGILASAWFVFLQVFVIKQICQYCMYSAVASFLLFLLGIFFLIKCKKNTSTNVNV